MALSFGLVVAHFQGSLGGKMKLKSMMISLGGSGLTCLAVICLIVAVALWLFEA